MYLPRQPKRNRKGISLSLKHNNQNNEINSQCRPPSPPSQLNQLDQSTAKFGQSICSSQQHNYVRVFQSHRGSPTPPITFTYHNAVKPQGNHNELYFRKELNLHNKLMDRKKYTEVFCQRDNRTQHLIQNERLRHHSGQPTKNINLNFPIHVPPPSAGPPVRAAAFHPPLTINHYERYKVPRVNYHTVLTIENKQMAMTKKQELNFRTFPMYGVFQQKIQKIVQQSNNRGQNLRTSPKITHQQIQNPAFTKDPQLSSTIKKQNKKQQPPFSPQSQYKTVSHQIQQYNKKLAQRMEQLRFAEQKLLDIINICNNNS